MNTNTNTNMDIKYKLIRTNTHTLFCTFYYLGYNLHYLCQFREEGWDNSVPFLVRTALKKLAALNKKVNLTTEEMYEYLHFMPPSDVRQGIYNFRSTKNYITYYGGNFFPLLSLYYRAVIALTQDGPYSLAFSKLCKQMLKALPKALERATKDSSKCEKLKNVNIKVSPYTTEFLYTLQSLYVIGDSMNSYKLYRLDPKKYEKSFCPFRPHEIVECYNSLIEVLKEGNATKKSLVSKLGVFDCECDDEDSPSYAYDCCVGYYASSVICEYLEIALFNSVKRFFAKDSATLRICNYEANIHILKECLKYLEQSVQKRDVCTLTNKPAFVKIPEFD